LELYAMWTWITAFLQASFQANPIAIEAPFWAKLGAFATIGFGTIGCLAGGVLADRFGRTSLTIGAMLLSGGCALLAGFLFGGPPWLMAAFCIFWGIVAIADSAQFSASVVELSDQERVGTMVTPSTPSHQTDQMDQCCGGERPAQLLL
jgi:MFS family permease